MITYKKGDLVDTPDSVIVHGMNNRGVMNAGVAKAIRAKWPQVYTDYIDAWNQRVSLDTMHEMLGTNIYTFVDGKTIVSCITQTTYGFTGKHVRYDAVDDCMKALSVNFKKLSMPRIGAGLGGGDWGVVEAIINHRLKDADVTVWEL